MATGKLPAVEKKSFSTHLQDAWGMKRLPDAEDAIHPKEVIDTTFADSWEKQQTIYRAEKLGLFATSEKKLYGKERFQSLSDTITSGNESSLAV